MPFINIHTYKTVEDLKAVTKEVAKKLKKKDFEFLIDEVIGESFKLGWHTGREKLFRNAELKFEYKKAKNKGYSKKQHKF